MSFNLLLPLIALAFAADAPKSGERKEPDQQIQGTWIIVKNIQGGEELPNEIVAKVQLVLDEKKMTIKPGIINENGKFRTGAPSGDVAGYALDPSKKPKQFDVIVEDKGMKFVAQGIYELDGDNLKICYNGRKRPSDFTSTAESRNILFVLKRAKK